MYACYKINILNQPGTTALASECIFFETETQSAYFILFENQKAVTWRDDGAEHIDPTESWQL